MTVETAQYMVCRLTKVAPKAMLNIPIKNPDEVCYHVPYLDGPVEVFKHLADAIAYRNEKNEELHNPKPNADGSISVNIFDMADTDYMVLDLQKAKVIKEE